MLVYSKSRQRVEAPKAVEERELCCWTWKVWVQGAAVSGEEREAMSRAKEMLFIHPSRSIDHRPSDRIGFLTISSDVSDRQHLLGFVEKSHQNKTRYLDVDNRADRRL